MRFPVSLVKAFGQVQRNFDYLSTRMNPVAAKVTRSATTQVIANNTLTWITPDTVIYDPQSMFNGVDALVVKESGYYLATGYINFQLPGPAVTDRYADIIVGSVGLIVSSRVGSNPTSNTDMPLSMPVYMAKGDYCELRAYQNSGVAVALTAALALTRIGGVA